MSTTDPKRYYAVLDIEALVFGPPYITLVEQVAIAFYDSGGTEVGSAHYCVYQPNNDLEISQIYQIPLGVVRRGISGYYKVTGDYYVHAAGMKWCEAKKRISADCDKYAIKVYAKGPKLENLLFKGLLDVYDLAPFGCPRYPGSLHNPLEECRFFSRWIPELKK